MPLGPQETHIVVSSQPFHRRVCQGRIAPDEDPLFGGGQDGVGTTCDGKSNAWRWLGRAALCDQHDKEKNHRIAKWPRHEGVHARIVTRFVCRRNWRRRYSNELKTMSWGLFCFSQKDQEGVARAYIGNRSEGSPCCHMRLWAE